MKRFLHWFKNVFWYHYKFIALAVLAGVLILSWLLWDAISAVTPDLTIVLAAEEMIDPGASQRLSELCSEITGDLNGDGKALCEVVSIPITGNIQYSEAQKTKLFVTLSAGDAPVYILSDPLSLDFAGRDCFEPLSGLGIASPDEFRLDLSSSRMISDAGLGELGPLYLCFRASSPAQKDGKTLDAAVNLALALADGPAG